MGQPNIIGRLKTNDKYQTIYDTVDGNDMARFKHETYAYSLEKEHTLFKSLYLYHGYSRVAKADFEQKWKPVAEELHRRIYAKQF